MRLFAHWLWSVDVRSYFTLPRNDPRVGYPLSVREWSIVSVFNSRHRHTVETKKLCQLHCRSGGIDAGEDCKPYTISGLHVSGRLLTDNMFRSERWLQVSACVMAGRYPIFHCMTKTSYGSSFVFVCGPSIRNWSIFIGFGHQFLSFSLSAFLGALMLLWGALINLTARNAIK